MQPGRRPELQRGPGAAGGGATAQGGSSHLMELPALKRPEPPTLRVLSPLMPGRSSPGQIGGGGDGSAPAGADDEFLDKNKGKAKRRGRKEKVTAEMRRKARQMRESERDEKAASERKEREEIFEVGEEGMSLEELAEVIQVDPSELVRTLFMKGIMLSMNQVRMGLRAQWGAWRRVRRGAAWGVQARR
jgi:translation initiation factor IF-2